MIVTYVRALPEKNKKGFLQGESGVVGAAPAVGTALAAGTAPAAGAAPAPAAPPAAAPEAEDEDAPGDNAH